MPCEDSGLAVGLKPGFNDSMQKVEEIRRIRKRLTSNSDEIARHGG